MISSHGTCYSPRLRGYPLTSTRTHEEWTVKGNMVKHVEGDFSRVSGLVGPKSPQTEVLLGRNPQAKHKGNTGKPTKKIYPNAGGSQNLQKTLGDNLVFLS